MLYERVMIVSENPDIHPKPDTQPKVEKPDIYTRLIALGTLAGVFISYLALAYLTHWVPFATAKAADRVADKPPRSPAPASPGPSSSTATPTVLSGSQIASAITAQPDNGEAVTNANCYQDTVRVNSDGATEAECDLTLDDGKIMRAAVTDAAGAASALNQYQENVSAPEIANALVGIYGVISQATVARATCNATSVQITADGTTSAECYLWMSNGDSFYAAAQYNGIASPGFHSN